MTNVVSDALGIIGAGIGAIFGGPTGAEIGWMAGSTLGSLIDPQKLPTQYGPRLQALTVQSSAYGTPIPEVFGAMRVAGNIIWATPIQEHKHEQTQGGKGGPTQTTVSYTYTCSFAVSLCEGPITGIRKVWADSKLIADRSTDASAATLLSNTLSANAGNKAILAIIARAAGVGTAGANVYFGGESQDPDPVIEAHEGAGNVPAHRGLAYIVFEDFPLKDYGNRIPNITAEVIVDGAAQSPTQVSDFPPHHGTYYDLPDGSSPYDPELIDAADGIITEGVIGANYYMMLSYDVDGNVVKRTVAPKGHPERLFVKYRPQAGLYRENFTDAAGNTHNSVWFDGATQQPLKDDVYGYVPGDHVFLSGVGAVYANGLLFMVIDRGWHNIQGGGVYHCYLAIFRGVEPIQYIQLPDTWDYDDYKRYDVDRASGRLVISTDSSADFYDYDSATDQYTLTKSIPVAWANTLIQTLAGDVLIAEYYDAYHVDLDAGTLTLIGPAPGASDNDYDSNGECAFFPGTQLLATRVGTVYYGDLIGDSAPSLASIASSLCVAAGLQAADLDLAQLAGLSVAGYARTGPMSARKALEPLLQAYYVDIAESDDHLKFIPRGQDPVATITEDDLAAHADGQSLPDPITRDRSDDLSLPRTFQIQYYNAAADYETNQQSATRLITDAVNVQTVQLPIVLSDDQARKTAEVLLYDAWQTRTAYQLQLPPSYADLDTADVIKVVTAEATYTLRVVSVDFALPGLITVHAVADEPAVYVPASAAGGAAPAKTKQIIAIPGPTDAKLLDCALLRDRDDGPGFYWAAAGYLAGWQGCVLYRSTDGGLTYNEIDSAFAAAVLGSAQTVLTAGPVTIWDEGSAVTVQLIHGQLSGTNDLAVLNGANAALLGAPGRWEVLNFADATLNSDGSYTLSRLLRGRRGTDWAVGTHQAGDAFVLLGAAAMQHVAVDAGEIGLSRDYKAVSAGSSLDAVSAQAFTDTGAALMPYSPVHIRATRNAAGDLAITWVRRSRLGGEWADYVGVPIGEAAESYELDVLDGSTVKRTLASTTPAVTYTAADQATDFGSAQASVAVNIYQLSATVGRGHPGSATL